MVSAESKKTKPSIGSSFYLSVWCSFLLLLLRSETCHGSLMSFVDNSYQKLNGRQQIIQVEGINVFGKTYSFIKVSRNGFIRFMESSEETANSIENVKPQILPLTQSVPFVAAFWTDPDLTANGTVWLRQMTNATEMATFEKVISNSFPSYQQRKAKYACDVIWNDIAFTSNSGNNSQLTNTFEVTLLTMEDRQYLIFHFGKLTWGDWKQMPQLNRSSSAVVGYDGGNKNNYLMLSGPGPNDIITGSNVNIPGVWIYRIDQRPCTQKSMTVIVLVATILSLLIGIVIGILCTCYCLRRMKKQDEDNLPLDNNAESPATNKSTEQLSILPPSNPSTPVFPTYAANLNVDTHVDKPPPRKIRVIKKNPPAPVP
ncbi:sushi, nidogen and EGF-like domain-containing protein 1 [Octopus bimaculoides]|uniref:NIDO domain-containing protein n=1 Tax=Octopus bimaculoides TaxID=37653 RepID=A0A0L8GZ48_OCTBM|nr:sushi, nidogen and EGF-like domain-containing protein 1 [Octopus bimaculoides]|eukprot:XP_014776863.1 PREDICTED: sushi, nidogen and EGF-like domain-containing protein 1 [Octopus bimaculoides]